MAFIIPWIFRAGTKAKSAEVNENFLAVKQFVDLLEEDVAANQIMVQTLDDTKANINGNALERFQVATAIVGNDAVNLNTLKKNTQNSRGFIDGLRLSATTKVVTASAGNCYSYNPDTKSYEYLITSNTSIQTNTLTLGANAKYYVFVCGDSSGAKYPQLSVTVNTTTPSLPSGLDCWRRLGSFTTDDSGNINEILNEGEKSLLGFSGFVTSFIGTITVTTGTNIEKTATQNMWLYSSSPADARTDAGTLTIYINIGGTYRPVAHLGRWSDFDSDPSSIFIPIKKGQKYKLVSDGNVPKTVYQYGMGG